MARSWWIGVALLGLVACKGETLEGKWTTSFNVEDKNIPLHFEMKHDGTWAGNVTTEATTADDLQIPAMTADATGSWELKENQLTFETRSINITNLTGPAVLMKGVIQDRIKDALNAYKTSKVTFPSPAVLAIETPGGDKLEFHRE